MTRAYVFHFTSKTGEKCSVTIDLIHRPFGYTMEQATTDAITSVIEVKGSQWIADYETQIVE